MTKTFRDEETGEKWQALPGESCTIGGLCIAPIPAPPQTEADILAEMDREISNVIFNDVPDYFEAKRFARAIVAACKKIGEGK